MRLSRPNPRLARAMDIMFTLHAEHEMNCSTAAARHLASSGVDVYTAIAGGAVGSYLHVKVCMKGARDDGHMHSAEPSRRACCSRWCVPVELETFPYLQHCLECITMAVLCVLGVRAVLFA